MTGRQRPPTPRNGHAFVSERLADVLLEAHRRDVPASVVADVLGTTLRDYTVEKLGPQVARGGLQRLLRDVPPRSA